MASLSGKKAAQPVSFPNPYRRTYPVPQQRTSIAWWLTLPLASLVLASTFLVGGLILRQSKQATIDIAQQLEQEISDRTLTQLQAWIEQPKTVNRLNQAAFSSQVLSLDAPDRLAQHFLIQLQAFPELHQLIAVDDQGRSVSLRREPLSGYRLQRRVSGAGGGGGSTAPLTSQSLAETTQPAGQVAEVLLLDRNGNPVPTSPDAAEAKEFGSDLRQTDWYQAAQAKSEPVWVKAFGQGEAIAALSVQGQDIADPQGVANTTNQVASGAVSARNSGTEVIASVIDLSRMGQQLERLKLPAGAQVFLLDDSGLLLSTSTKEAALLRDRQGNWNGRQAVDSQNDLTRATANYLIPLWTGAFPNEPQPFDFELEGKTIRGQMLSYEPYEGAQWLLAVALPEDSVLGSVRSQQLQLLILCLGLLLLSLLICRWLAQWITRPLRQLSHAAQTLGQGNWKLELFDELAHRRQDELGELARSFGWMGRYLQDSFHQLEGQKQQLQQHNQTLKDEKARLKELDRFKDDFLATTTQELSMPLAGILGLAESLRAQVIHSSDGSEANNGTSDSSDSHRSGAQRKLVGTDLSQQEASHQAAIELIIFNARRLTTLVNDLLDLSKAKHNSLRLSCSGIELHRVAQHVLALCAPLAAPKRLRLINDIPAAFPLAYGDSHRVQQIFYHLVSNAIKFTPDGEVTLSAEIVLSDSESSDSGPSDSKQAVLAQKRLAKSDPQIAAHRAAQGGNQGAEQHHSSSSAPIRHIAITVRDTGVGLKPELQAQLAQVFQLPSDEAKHDYGGKGLGLTIVQTFVELHGGSLKARSRQQCQARPCQEPPHSTQPSDEPQPSELQPSQGAEFCFTLPILESVAVRPSRARSSLASSRASDKLDAFATKPQLHDLHCSSQDRNGRNVTAIQPPAGNLEQESLFETDDAMDEQPLWELNGNAAHHPSSAAGNRQAEAAQIEAQAEVDSIYSTFVQRTAVQPQPLARAEATLPTSPLSQEVIASTALLAENQTRYRKARTRLASNGNPRARILVIDDDAINLEVLMRQLSLDNYHVVSATNGEEALKLLDPMWGNEHFDLVILEVMMPRMSGYEVCRKLREDYPSYQLPVIMLTAKVQVQDVVEGFRAGANDYLRKPFSSDELRSRIQTHLTNRLYGRFVPAHFLKFLHKSSIAEITLGNQVSRDMTVLFSDIRGFATLSETMSPQENFDYINRYFQCVSPEVRRHQGFIVKYLGDGMMAIFPQGAADAITAGIAQLKRIRRANQQHLEQGASSVAEISSIDRSFDSHTSFTQPGRTSPSLPPTQIGIGIHYGPMTVGIVGEAQRMQGDAFSDDVNLTARLEGLTKFYGVSMLISEQVRQRLDPDHPFQIRLLDRVQVKGRSQPLAIYEVFDGDEADQRDRKAQTQLHFEAGVHCYQAGEFVAAQGHFRAVAAANPSDRPAKLYCRRVARLIAKPPKGDWIGVSAWGRK